MANKFDQLLSCHHRLRGHVFILPALPLARRRTSGREDLHVTIISGCPDRLRSSPQRVGSLGQCSAPDGETDGPDLLAEAAVGGGRCEQALQFGVEVPEALGEEVGG